MQTRKDTSVDETTLFKQIYRHRVTEALQFPIVPIERYQRRPKPNTYDEAIDPEFFLACTEAILRTPITMLWIIFLASVMVTHYAVRSAMGGHKKTPQNTASQPCEQTLSAANIGLFSASSQSKSSPSDCDENYSCSLKTKR